MELIQPGKSSPSPPFLASHLRSPLHLLLSIHNILAENYLAVSRSTSPTLLLFVYSDSCLTSSPIPTLIHSFTGEPPPSWDPVTTPKFMLK